MRRAALSLPVLGLLPLPVFVVVLAAGCGQDATSKTGDSYTGPRFTSAEDRFSVRQLDGWQMSRDRGSVLFIDERPSLAKHTIAIRMVPLEGATEPRTAEVVLPATQQALAGLPGVRLSAPMDLDRADVRAVAFDLTFAPPGLRGARYQRRHVVIATPTGVWHLIHTAPDGELMATAAEFQSVVDSFREEIQS